MTITAVSAYLLIACYFWMERLLRKNRQALDLNPGAADAGSSQVLRIGGAIGILLAIAAPALNTHRIGDWSYAKIGWLGLILMIGGLAMRYWVAKTLGKFYTRTLQIVEGQEIVNQAPYNVIRHPGYLGTFLMEIGAGLAVTNWVVFLVAVVIGIMSRAYRIDVEEKMLKENFEKRYKAYSDKTWRLIPLLY
jgi:protein-S-isoprenylcysteine O-methyltransferase Ste14